MNKLRQADEKVRQSRLEIAEAEQSATSTLTRLQEQREKLQRSKMKLDEAGKDLSESNSTVDSMASNCLVG